MARSRRRGPKRSNAFVGLMAAAGAAAFYRRYGYEPRPPDRPGMFKIVARRRDH